MADASSASSERVRNSGRTIRSIIQEMLDESLKRRKIRKTFQSKKKNKRRRKKISNILKSWSSKDLEIVRKFVSGRRDYDLKRLFDMLPNKKRSQVSRAARRFALRINVVHACDPLSKLRKLVRKNTSRANFGTNLPTYVVPFFMHFLPHPDPEKCGGCDFKILYEALCCLLINADLPEMNEATKLMFSSSFNALQHLTTFIPENKVELLRKIVGRLPSDEAPTQNAAEPNPPITQNYLKDDEVNPMRITLKEMTTLGSINNV